MKNTITFRKTPHGRRTRATVFGEETYIETRFAWSFIEQGNENSEVIWKEVPLPHCFVKDNRQEVPDAELRPMDMRSCTVDVYTARQKNMDKGLGWRTNWEILQDELKELQKPATLMDFIL